MSNGRLDLSGLQNFQFPLTTPMAGATTSDEFEAFVVPSDVPNGITLVSARWVPAAAVTANGSNFSTLSIRNRGTAAGAALPFTRSYAATNSVAFTGEAMTASGTAADLLCVANDLITIQRIFTASGVVIPAGLVTVFYTVR